MKQEVEKKEHGIKLSWLKLNLSLLGGKVSNLERQVAELRRAQLPPKKD